VATDADLAARRSPYADWTIAKRAALHEEAAARKAAEIEARRALGDAYLQQHAVQIDVPSERAVATADLVEETRSAREEALALAEGRAAKIDNGALEFPVLAHQFAVDGPAIAFGTSPLVLAAVTRYLGMLPILFNMFYTRAHQTELRPNTAHRFHLDPEDTRSFKVFVHLTDVDADCGPLHVLPAEHSALVLDAVDYRGVTMLDDSTVADLVGWDSVVQVIGPPGTVAFADTTRCLHFGGRPRAEGKPVRDMLVYQYLLPTSILLNGDDVRHFFPQLPATGDDTWDAVTGRRYT